MGKEKLLGISMRLKASKMSGSRLNAWAQGSAGGHGSHVCCRVAPSLGAHGSGGEEMLLTLYLLHVSFNPSQNGWCPLKGRAITLAGAKMLSPSEMPQRLSVYKTPGRSRTQQAEKLAAALTGKHQLQAEGGNSAVVIQILEKFWIIPVLSPAKITLHKSASLLFGG